MSELAKGMIVNIDATDVALWSANVRYYNQQQFLSHGSIT